MPKNGLNVSLNSYDDIFSTEETRQEEQREQVQQIPIDELYPFKDHPFKVLDDEAMQRTVESIKQLGVTNPLIARPRPDGGYEIISGHRRQHAAQLARLKTLPVCGGVITAVTFHEVHSTPHAQTSTQSDNQSLKNFDSRVKEFHSRFSFINESCRPSVHT